MKSPIRYIPVDGMKSSYYAYAGDDILDVFKMRGTWVAMLGGCADEGSTRDEAVTRARAKFEKELRAAKAKPKRKG